MIGKVLLHLYKFKKHNKPHVCVVNGCLKMYKNMDGKDMNKLALR